MSVAPTSLAGPVERIQESRAKVAEVRDRARRLFEGGATGLQVAAAISEGTEAVLRDFIDQALAGFSPSDRAEIVDRGAVIAVGGTGRGDLSPYSDVDLQFLFAPSAQRVFREFASAVVRDCWDAGLKLGHSIRTIAETTALARSDNQVATALVEARLLFGSTPLFEKFQRQVWKKVFRGRFRPFLAACVVSREKERAQHSATGLELEPDVKKSLGGLRDLHLLRWIAFAKYRTPDFDSLRLNGVFTRDEALALVTAQEFLLRIRADLHFTAGKPNDVLTKDEQLRIAIARGYESTPGMRDVEQFMREYFRQTTAVTRIVRRFLVAHSRPPLHRRLMRSLVMHRVNGMFRAGDGHIDALPRYRNTVASNLESILKLYLAGAMYGYVPEPSLVELIRQNAPSLPRQISKESANLFLRLMGCPGGLGAALRSLYDCGVLELIVPSMVHARCLLQFNQYHHYTVDEHTLRTIEEAEKFDKASGPIGDAYRSIRNKSLLHLALLLHDLGKGFEEDHSDVGRGLAMQMSDRLWLNDHDRDTLVFLVHQHLKLATIALRRDLDDPAMLLQLSQEMGSAEHLKMLYVLTAADISGVGPGIFTGWKADLLTELYNRLLHMLTGEKQAPHLKERTEQTIEQVKLQFAPLGEIEDVDLQREWAATQLAALPSHYLNATPADRIVADLRVIRTLSSGQVRIEADYDPDTESVEYRIIADAAASEGCFHKIAGTLTAKRMEILSAQISTAAQGVVLDTFRVLDRDYRGPVPRERSDDVAASIRKVLTGNADVESMFQRGRRFGAGQERPAVSNLPMKVAIDNASSDRSTIIDVFAHDRTGLLYTITRGLYELGLSVTLAKISTHFDQVVDVFYVTDAQGARVTDEARLKHVQDELTQRIAAFETHGWKRFVS